MYNLTEYSDNYSDTSWSLWQYKRDEIVDNANVSENGSSSFKYKSGLIGDTAGIEKKGNVKITVPLKYFSNFWSSLEMSLVNCEIKLSLTRGEKCILSSAGNAANF